MKIHSHFLPLAGLCLLLTACQWKGTDYHHFIAPQTTPWQRLDTIRFADTLYFERDNAPSHLLLETILRHDDLYPYEEIYLNADITVGFTQDSTRANGHSSHTFRISLVNSRHHWSGSGWGSLYTVESPTYTISLSDKYFQQAATVAGDESDTTRLQLPFRIDITSAMADESLKGCDAVGLRLYN